MKENNIEELLQHYDFNLSQYVGYKVISSGHIHTTYVLYFDLKNRVKRFLLQQINTNVFCNPSDLMENIHIITTFCKNKIKYQYHSKYKDKILRLYLTKDKKEYVELSDHTYWRIYHYIENSITYDKNMDLKVYYEAGLVIGQFHQLLADFDYQKLKPILVDFHHSVKRYECFLDILKNSDAKLQKSCQKEIDFFILNQHIPHLIQDLIDQQKMPIKVTHNDTKLNNIIFEYGTNKGKCLVDLDTIMPGCVCFDYGDFVRSACNFANEDEKNLSKVQFNEEGWYEFTTAFLLKCQNHLSEIEVLNLINGAIDMCYECGLRFLSDYLNHNVYFKINYPTHNLIRCRTQIKMCQQILLQKEKLEQKVIDLYQKMK